MKQQKLTFLLTLLMSMTGITANAHDFEVENDDGVTIYYKWNATFKGMEVSCRGSNPYEYANEYQGKVVIPETVTYDGTTYTVYGIAQGAFDHCTDLTEVVLPNGLWSIWEYAFNCCTSLTSVNIPNTVVIIGSAAFAGCYNLSSLEIPNSVTSIQQGAFQYCQSLTSMVIPNSVTSIEEMTFTCCTGLTSVTIPNSVTSIGREAFSGCTNLTSLEIPNSVTSIEGQPFSDCSGLTSIVVEEGNKKYDSRDNCNAIIETNSNTLIAGCKNTTFPSSVTCIGNFAFYGCTGLTSMSIPNNVTTIGLGVFIGCSSLTSIVVEEGNSNYDSRDNCNAIIETETNTLIAVCKNTIIPNSVTSIGEGAFYGCSSLTSLSIPESVKTIGNSTFRRCTGLTTVTIPNSVTSIGENAFDGCTGLSSVTIGSGVTSIGYRAFYDCTALESVISLIEEPFEIKKSVFCYLDKETYSNQLFTTATLYVPKGTKAKYLATSAWNLFGENIVEMENPTVIKSARNEETEKTEGYDLNGCRLNTPKKGLNIIHMSDGTIKKVVVK